MRMQDANLFSDPRGQAQNTTPFTGGPKEGLRPDSGPRIMSGADTNAQNERSTDLKAWTQQLQDHGIKTPFQSYTPNTDAELNRDIGTDAYILESEQLINIPGTSLPVSADFQNLTAEDTARFLDASPIIRFLNSQLNTENQVVALQEGPQDQANLTLADLESFNLDSKLINFMAAHQSGAGAQNNAATATGQTQGQPPEQAQFQNQGINWQDRNMQTQGFLTAATQNNLLQNNILQNGSLDNASENLASAQPNAAAQTLLAGQDTAQWFNQDRHFQTSVLQDGGLQAAGFQNPNGVLNSPNNILTQGLQTNTPVQLEDVLAQASLEAVSGEAVSGASTNTQAEIDPTLTPETVKGSLNAAQIAGTPQTSAPIDLLAQLDADMISLNDLVDHSGAPISDQISDMIDQKIATQGTPLQTADMALAKAPQLTLTETALLTDANPFSLSAQSPLGTLNTAGPMITNPNAPVAGPQTVALVTDAMLLAKETSKGVTVQLDPPEMGRVYIDFIFDADKPVTVVIKTESSDAQHMLRERSEAFLAMLKENGLDDANLSFELHDGGDFEGFSDPSGQSSDSLFFEDDVADASLSPTRAVYTRTTHYSDGLDLRL